MSRSWGVPRPVGLMDAARAERERTYVPSDEEAHGDFPHFDPFSVDQVPDNYAWGDDVYTWVDVAWIACGVLATFAVALLGIAVYLVVAW